MNLDGLYLHQVPKITLVDDLKSVLLNDFSIVTMKVL